MKHSRIVVITGGASGIGREVAFKLANQQTQICLLDTNVTELKKTASDLSKTGTSARGYLADVTSSDRVLAVFDEIQKEFGAATVLVTAAGIPGHGTITELTDERWDQVLKVNLDAVFVCMRAAIRQMVPARKGVIVNISSLCGLAGCASSPAYSAAKAGVIGLSKACARKHISDGIRINVIAPGLVDTPFIEADKQMGKLEQGIAKIPLNRMGRPEEIASLVAYLCSDEADFIQGQVISPNGGQWI